MDFNVSADPPHVVEFRKEVGAWLAEQFKGNEHLRWSASWSTREDQTSTSSAAAWPKSSAPRAGYSRFIPNNMAAPNSPSIIRWCWKPSCSSTASISRTRFTPWRASSRRC